MQTVAEIRKARKYSRSLGGDVLPSEQSIDTLLFWIGTLRLQIKVLLTEIEIVAFSNNVCENVVESTKKLLEETEL